MQGWIDLFVNRILADVVGAKAAPFVFTMICAFMAMLAATPFLVVLITRYVLAVRGALAVTEEKLDRLSQRHLEMHNLVKESFALVQERLATVPPPVRFGPQDPPADGAPVNQDAGGQGSYNYCPGCKEIRFIKFLRCQTCGFHVTPGK